MTITRIEIDDRGVQEAFDRLIALGEDPDSLLKAIGGQMEANVKLGFMTGTDPYGIPWAPLKIRAGQPLRDKGDLMRSVSYKVEGNEVVIGTNYGQLPSGGSIAAVHQFGMVIEPKQAGGRLVFPGPDGMLIFARKVTIPARRMFPLDGLPAAWGDDLLVTLRAAAVDAWDGGTPA